MHDFLNEVDAYIGQTNITFHQVEVNQYAVFQYPPYDITLSTKISEVIKRI